MRETDTEITKKDKEETQTENGEVCIEETANSEDEIKENTSEAEFDSENTETEEAEDEDKDFEEVIPTRKRKMSCFINTIILGGIIAFFLYVLITITGDYNSFSDKEVMNYSIAVSHERMYGTFSDADWKRISGIEIEKYTLEDGSVVVENWRRGILLFGYGNENPSMYRPKLIWRFIINIPLLLIMIVIIEIMIFITYVIYYHGQPYEYDDYDDEK